MHVVLYTLNAQFPLLFSRYRDTSWNGRHFSMRNPYTSRSFTDKQIPVLNGTVTDKIFGSNWTNYNFRMDTSSFNTLLPSWKGHEVPKNEFSLSSPNLQSFLTKPSTQAKVEDETYCSRNSAQERRAMKRTTSDSNLDLDLTLRLTQAKEEKRPSSEEDDVGLSLSLCGPPSSSKLSRLKGEDDSSRENGRRVSTLDLTI